MIWCLHGFLGSSADWTAFDARWSEAAGMPVCALDLFEKPLAAETPAQWAAKFVRSVGKLDAEPFLVGYSLGGRLALHALLAAPALFRGAVIVSAGLGVEEEEARQARRVRDDWWAARFESEPWEVVTRAWNAQPLFGGSPLPSERDEMAFDRDALATALRWWSPAVQKPIAALLPGVTTPVLWVAGARDERYLAEGRRAAEALPSCTLWIAAGAGHRVPWDVPDEFAARVAAFLAAHASRGAAHPDI